MTAISKTSAKAYFETGDKPTQAQFGDLIDSYQNINSNLTTLASASLGAVGVLILGAATTAAAQAIIGTGDMLKSVYDAASINEQLIGVSAAQSQYNKTLVRPNTVGTNTNNDAAAGSVGEFTSQTGSQALTSPTAANVTSISLTAGDWDVWGQIQYAGSGTTTIQQMTWGISTTSATLPAATDSSYGRLTATINAGQADEAFAVGTKRISLSATTTVYLVASSTFGISTLTGNGGIFARRVR